MGVMNCHRNGCTNIMCDRYSDEHGYICSDCFEELCANNNVDIDTFMLSNKVKKNNSRAWQAYCEVIFESA